MAGCLSGRYHERMAKENARFGSHLSLRTNTLEAAEEACQKVLEQLAGPANLAALFVSSDHAAELHKVAPLICDRLGTECLIGCTGESIVGSGREVEMDTALSLWAARLPKVQAVPMHLMFERTPEGAVINGWPDEYASTWPAGTALLTVGDPFSFPVDMMLERLNEDRPGVRVIGGMASAGSQPGENRIVIGRKVVTEGAAVVMLSGALRLRTVVSQGCRPIGVPFVVTKAEQNLILELGGKPALIQLKEIFDTLPTREQQLVQSGLHVGRVINEYRDQFGYGDFLIRNVIGIEPQKGAIAIGDFVRPGQTVQFHLRDHETADEDLRQLLTAAKQADHPAAGALLFTCNGRGTRLFKTPHHDAACIRELLGNIPLAGLFAAGELGPVGNQNFMHGFTASVALFE